MRKFASMLLLLLFFLSLVGCGKETMNDIISGKPSVTGTVEEVYENSVILYADANEMYPSGSHWSIPLSVEYADSYTDLSVGDEIVVYYDGNVMETYPLQIGHVYAITLKTPADRTVNEKA